MATDNNYCFCCCCRTAVSAAMTAGACSYVVVLAAAVVAVVIVVVVDACPFFCARVSFCNADALSMQSGGARITTRAVIAATDV